MLTDYIKAAMHQAKYEILEDDGTFFGKIPGFQGVWANAATLEECRDELGEVLEEWIFLNLADKTPVPVVDGLTLTVERVS